MIGMQQYAGLSLVVLGRLACGRTKSANLYHKVFEEKSSACRHSCLGKKNSSACRHSCQASVEDRLWIHNAIGHWAYQAKKEEEEQINVVLFVTENQ